MFGFVDSLARRLVRRGIRRGLLEGNPMWLAIGAVALVVRLLLRPEKVYVSHEELRLGETITVTHAPPDLRTRPRQRRRPEPDA